MYLLLRLRHLTALSVGDVLFFFLFVTGVTGYLFIQAAQEYLSDESIRGTNNSHGWKTVSIKRASGVDKNGMTIAKGLALFEQYDEQIEWFAGFENGQVDLKFNNETFKNVKPQLYTNDALKNLDVQILHGRLPDSDKDEVLISYDFWLDISKGNEDIIGEYLRLQDDDASLYMITGIAAKNFNSLFKGEKYDFFVSAKSWILRNNANPMYWQFMQEVKQSQISFRYNENVSINDAVLNLTALNHNLIDGIDSELVISSGLQRFPSELARTSLLISFFKLLVSGLLALSFCAFYIYYLLKITKKKKEYKIRSYIGESDVQIGIFEFIKVFTYLFFVIIISIIIFKAIAAISSYNFFLESINLTLKSQTQLILLSMLSLVFSILLSRVCVNLAQGRKVNLNLNSAIILSISLLLVFVLTSLALMSSQEIRLKLTKNRNFDIANITQVEIEVNKNINHNFSKHEISSILQKSFENSIGVDSYMVSSVTPIHGYNYGSTQEINSDGKLYIKESFYANVGSEYFNFFGIGTLSGRVPEEVSGSEVVIINEELAKNYGGNSNAIGKKLDNGKDIVAVVQDAHFVNQSKVSLPFSYQLSDQLDNVIILVKGSITDEKLTTHLDELLKLNNHKFSIKSVDDFDSLYANFFNEDIQRKNFTNSIIILVYLFSLFALSSVANQWITMNKKIIAIKLALGLTLEKMWLRATLKMCVWTLLVLLISLFFTFSIKIKYFALLDTFEVIYFSMVSWLVFVTTIALIFRKNIMKINDSFITEALQN